MTPDPGPGTEFCRCFSVHSYTEVYIYHGHAASSVCILIEVTVGLRKYQKKPEAIWKEATEGKRREEQKETHERSLTKQEDASSSH